MAIRSGGILDVKGNTKLFSGARIFGVNTATNLSALAA